MLLRRDKHLFDSLIFFTVKEPPSFIFDRRFPPSPIIIIYCKIIFEVTHSLEVLS